MKTKDYDETLRIAYKCFNLLLSLDEKIDDFDIESTSEKEKIKLACDDAMCSVFKVTRCAEKNKQD